ncbi:hypothetical protein, partial [Actinotalea sp.]|uniref:hypothetical protein n=1 Tax=Actinotalea sp. TaxID=1872145 RepID=UPI0035620097
AIPRSRLSPEGAAAIASTGRDSIDCWSWTGVMLMRRRGPVDDVLLVTPRGWVRPVRPKGIHERRYGSVLGST